MFRLFSEAYKEDSLMTYSAIGAVSLNVASLGRLLPFYQDIIGLKIHRQEGKTVTLGTGGEDLLILHETPDAPRLRGVTGLYHFAILLPSREALALQLKHFAETRTQLQGLSDHFVSEAIYLADPEGNGIEIYRDRPRSEWYDANGTFQMGTVAMDVDGVFSALEDPDKAEWKPMPVDTVMGHIHLHVHDVKAAEAFYGNQLNLDVLVNMGSATFMSYEGYHHHLGANIWAGRTIRPENILGLKSYELRVPQAIPLGSLLGKLEGAGSKIETAGDSYRFYDPSMNQIILSQAAVQPLGSIQEQEEA
jgi:catechol 2,3-dioxygenase